MRSFVLKLLAFSIFIAAADYCWNRFVSQEYFVPHIWFIFSFFVGTTMLFHVVTMNVAKGKPQNFIRYYMGSTALRMALFVAVILVYRFMDKPTLIPFALGFLVHYFLFTIFEVIVLLQQLRSK